MSYFVFEIGAFTEGKKENQKHFSCQFKAFISEIIFDECSLNISI